MRNRNRSRQQSVHLRAHTHTTQPLPYLGWKAPVFKQSKQVCILSVDIATDFNGRTEFEEHGLLHANVPSQRAQLIGVIDLQIYRCTRFLVAYRKQTVNNAVNPLLSAAIGRITIAARNGIGLSHAGQWNAEWLGVERYWSLQKVARMIDSAVSFLRHYPAVESKQHE
jgi:hypothetical protein